jgi:hypothetical protein
MFGTALGTLYAFENAAKLATTRFGFDLKADLCSGWGRYSEVASLMPNLLFLKEKLVSDYIIRLVKELGSLLFPVLRTITNPALSYLAR